jgi:hypothetical protein
MISALNIDSHLFRCVIIFVGRALKFDSLLYSCCVASINRTEAGQPRVVYSGFLVLRGIFTWAFIFVEHHPVPYLSQRRVPSFGA